MVEERGPGLLDRAVEILASAMDSVGLNGTRLRWRWNQRRRDLGEAVLRSEMTVRSARGRFKMCPSCRALVPRSARRCPECGQGLSRVRAPGIGRFFSNLIPGATAATALLVLANGLVYVFMLIVPYTPPGFEPGRSSLLGFDGFTLLRYGSGSAFLVLAGGEWWRLLTPVFLHAGIMHFGFNTWALVQLGPLAEEEYGTERFAAIYLLAGLGSTVTALVIGRQNMVGASGAICGLLGLLLVHGIRRGGAYGNALKRVMLHNTVLIAVISFLPGISLLGHLGGFAVGFGLGWVVPYGAFRSRSAELLWSAAALVGVALVLWAFWRMAVEGPSGVAALLRSHGA